MTLRNGDEILSSKARVEAVDRGVAVLSGNGSLAWNSFSAAAFLGIFVASTVSLLQVTCAVSCSHRLAGPATRNHAIIITDPTERKTHAPINCP